VPHDDRNAGQWRTLSAGELEPDAGGDTERISRVHPRRPWRRFGAGAGIAAGVLGLVYLGDLLANVDSVPRGTTVDGIAIGGMTRSAAERELQEQLGPALDRPVQVRAGDAGAALDPKQSGLQVSWTETVDRAGDQSYNPITRLSSFFTTNDVEPVTHVDREQLGYALSQVRAGLDRAPVEGDIRFAGAQPQAVEPVAGRSVDLPAATEAVAQQWTWGGPVVLPTSQLPVRTTSEGVHRTLEQIAVPATASPLVVHGDGADATIPPQVIAQALTFQPDGTGGLRPLIDQNRLTAEAQAQLAPTLRPGVDARFTVEDGHPAVQPSVDGRGIDWNKTFEQLPQVLSSPGQHAVQAAYVPQPARLTTDQANGLGIREVVGQFTTSPFDPRSGVNIRRVAEQVNGAVVKPGDTFSLNGHTGPRGIPQGYIPSGVIENGRPAEDVGGGISQFATTLYNASYFAGMQDVEHKEHSYYINKYPMGREATVFEGPDGRSVIDVKFRNTSASGIMITTEWTPSSITVTLWGTKQFDVTSQTGPVTDPTPPQEMTVPPGQPCEETQGKPGFTVTDTRTLRDLRTGQVITEKPQRTVYQPQPIVHCPPPPG
jgi:vancomycin resistance protein YoaR